MSMPSARNQLKSAYAKLVQAWDQTCQQWNDPAQAAFEKEFLSGLEPSMRGAVAAMDAMTEVLARARRECE